jgi:hypothetical protein
MVNLVPGQYQVLNEAVKSGDPELAKNTAENLVLFSEIRNPEEIVRQIELLDRKIGEAAYNSLERRLAPVGALVRKDSPYEGKRILEESREFRDAWRKYIPLVKAGKAWGAAARILGEYAEDKVTSALKTQEHFLELGLKTYAGVSGPQAKKVFSDFGAYFAPERYLEVQGRMREIDSRLSDSKSP